VTWRAAAKLAELKPGDVIGIEVNGIAMVLARDGDSIYALQRQCLHRGGDLADGILSRGHLICPVHGWRFAAATGRHDQASDVCLVRYATRVVGDQIEVDPEPL
jgi:nitrite reductase/ring-hydroxylating ferredoxin subunit